MLLIVAGSVAQRRKHTKMRFWSGLSAHVPSNMLYIKNQKIPLTVVTQPA
jgi:hypothetical protein